MHAVTAIYAERVMVAAHSRGVPSLQGVVAVSRIFPARRKWVCFLTCWASMVVSDFREAASSPMRWLSNDGSSSYKPNIRLTRSKWRPR